jgi:hypothetical protein
LTNDMKLVLFSTFNGTVFGKKIIVESI